MIFESKFKILDCMAIFNHISVAVIYSCLPANTDRNASYPHSLCVAYTK